MGGCPTVDRNQRQAPSIGGDRTRRGEAIDVGDPRDFSQGTGVFRPCDRNDINGAFVPAEDDVLA